MGTISRISRISTDPECLSIIDYIISIQGEVALWTCLHFPVRYREYTQSENSEYTEFEKRNYAQFENREYIRFENREYTKFENRDYKRNENKD